MNERLFLFFWGCYFMATLSSNPLQAQDVAHKIHWGIAAPVAGKIGLIPGGGTAYSIWGNAGFCVTSELEGTDEQALSLLTKAGITLDFTQYKIPAYGWYVLNRGNFFFNPEILFPLRNARLKATVGIGLEYNFYFLGQLDNASGIQYQGMEDLVQRSRRKFHPFFSGGLQYNLKRGIYVQLFIRQALMDYFVKDTVLPLGQSGGTGDLKLSEQPTYLGFCFSYFFD